MRLEQCVQIILSYQTPLIQPGEEKDKGKPFQFHEYLKGDCSEDGARLFIDAQYQGKRPRAQTETQVVPSEQQESLLCC